MLGALYDTLRLTRVLLGVCHYADFSKRSSVPCPFPKRRTRSRKRPAVFRDVLLVMQDLLFCLAAGAVVMILLFYGNDGGFRGFVLLGLVSGFLLYYATIGALVVRASEYLIFWLKTAVLYAVFYLTRPAVFLARLLRRGAKRLFERTMLWRLRRYDAKKKKNLLEMSEKGFVGLDWIENGSHQTYRSKRGHRHGQKTVHRGESPSARERVRLHLKRQRRRNKQHGIVGAGAP